LIEATGFDGSAWSGSGFYTSADGNIVTNCHVISGAKTLKITENDGEVYEGSVRIIAYSEESDIAVLDINKTVNLFLNTGDSGKVELGEEIYAIGSPLGLKNTLSSGIISSIREGIFQISAPISEGSSGGVLLNTRGEAVGITFAGIDLGENLGFAIPINEYTKLSKNLNLSLDAFYNRIYAVGKPEGVTVTLLQNNVINVKWNEVNGAYSYRVYISNSESGEYLPVTNQSGYDEWSWDESGLNISNNAPDTTYFIKVTALKDTFESMPSDVKTVTTESAMSYGEYENYLLDTYGTLDLDGYTADFDEIRISDNYTDGIDVSFYLADPGNFNNMMKYDRDDLEYEISEIAREISYYYTTDVVISVVYTSRFSSYPSDFEYNRIYQDSVTQDGSQWLVFYPYIYLEYSNYDDEYYTEWAY
jgi:hypothetical protein